jgi:putative transcriptional regulator
MPKPIILTSLGDTLAGQFLIATSQIQDDFFHRSVIYMCEHNAEGAMGIIINTAIDKISIDEILDQMQMNGTMGDRKLPIMFGGPVEAYRGFVVHSGNYLQDTAIASHHGITVTANTAVLSGWLTGEFNAKAMLALGYAGWTPGQLEKEIETGSWVSIAATESLLFDVANEDKWDVAIASLGFDVGNLSSTVGHA